VEAGWFHDSIFQFFKLIYSLIHPWRRGPFGLKKNCWCYRNITLSQTTRISFYSFKRADFDSDRRAEGRIRAQHRGAVLDRRRHEGASGEESKRKTKQKNKNKNFLKCPRSLVVHRQVDISRKKRKKNLRFQWESSLQFSFKLKNKGNLNLQNKRTRNVEEGKSTLRVDFEVDQVSLRVNFKVKLDNFQVDFEVGRVNYRRGPRVSSLSRHF